MYAATLDLAEYCYLYGVMEYFIMAWLNMRFLRLNLDILGVMTMLLAKWSARYIFTQVRSFLCFVQTIYSMSSIPITWLCWHRKKNLSMTRWQLHYSAYFYWQLLVFTD